MAQLAESAAIAAWLEKVRAGLGTHAHVFMEYGATTVADLGDVGEEDIDALVDALESRDPRPRPLQIKQIARALRGEVAMKAGMASARELQRRKRLKKAPPVEAAPTPAEVAAAEAAPPDVAAPAVVVEVDPEGAPALREAVATPVFVEATPVEAVPAPAEEEAAAKAAAEAVEAVVEVVEVAPKPAAPEAAAPEAPVPEAPAPVEATAVEAEVAVAEAATAEADR